MCCDSQRSYEAKPQDSTQLMKRYLPSPERHFERHPRRRRNFLGLGGRRTKQDSGTQDKRLKRFGIARARIAAEQDQVVHLSKISHIKGSFIGHKHIDAALLRFHARKIICLAWKGF